MLKKILQFFFEDTSKEFSSYKLFSKLSNWAKDGYLPYQSELPETINFDSSFWKRIIQIHNDTKYDDHERAFSVFWADGELVITGNTKGSTNNVVTNSIVKVSYKQSRHKGYFTKEVFVDSQLYSSKDIFYKSAPTKIIVMYLFNMHTHPAHKMGESEHYNFFSLTDINSLINSKAIITGMISDKLWILIKTNKSPKILNNYEQSEISVSSLNEKIKLNVYCGELGKKLNKITS